MDSLLQDAVHEFRRYKKLADAAMTPLAAEEFYRRPAPQVNSVAIIVKHLGGNLRSRWTDFLTTDGEKPWRDRDAEFVIGEEDSRAKLLTAWEAGWDALFGALQSLSDADLDKKVTIRGEAHSVRQAVLRALSHVAYHVGQIQYLVRWMRPDAAWLTIAPGQSGKQPGSYRRKPG